MICLIGKVKGTGNENSLFKPIINWKYITQIYEHICNIFVLSKNTFADTLGCGLATRLTYVHELFASLYTGQSEIEHWLSVFYYHSYAF